MKIDEKSLPLTVRLSGVRVRAWQGIPDITVDKAEQVDFLESTPWDSSIDLKEHMVEVDLTDLVNSSSRVGIKTNATVVSVREDTGIIQRCTQCRRVLRDGVCAQHGNVESVEDIRMRLVIDDGMSTASLLVNKEATLNLLESDEDKVKKDLESMGKMDFVQTVRDRLLGRKIEALGRSIVDDQGAMILADSVSLIPEDSGLIATEIRAKWGLIDAAHKKCKATTCSSYVGIRV